MISFERFEELILKITGDFPDDFFRELNGGVFAREEVRLHPKGISGDLFVMGEYHVDRFLGRFIVIYYGSFEKVYWYLNEEELAARLRKVLLHEFRHHLESLAGEQDLEVEDSVQIAEYLKRKEE